MALDPRQVGLLVTAVAYSVWVQSGYACLKQLKYLQRSEVL